MKHSLNLIKFLERNWQDQNVKLAILGLDIPTHKPLRFEGMVQGKKVKTLFEQFVQGK